MTGCPLCSPACPHLTTPPRGGGGSPACHLDTDPTATFAKGGCHGGCVLLSTTTPLCAHSPAPSLFPVRKPHRALLFVYSFYLNIPGRQSFVTASDHTPGQREGTDPLAVAKVERKPNRLQDHISSAPWATSCSPHYAEPPSPRPLPWHTQIRPCDRELPHLICMATGALQTILYIG